MSYTAAVRSHSGLLLYPSDREHNLRRPQEAVQPADEDRFRLLFKAEKRRYTLSHHE